MKPGSDLTVIWVKGWQNQLVGATLIEEPTAMLSGVPLEEDPIRVGQFQPDNIAEVLQVLTNANWCVDCDLEKYVSRG